MAHWAGYKYLDFIAVLVPMLCPAVYNCLVFVIVISTRPVRPDTHISSSYQDLDCKELISSGNLVSVNSPSLLCLVSCYIQMLRIVNSKVRERHGSLSCVLHHHGSLSCVLQLLRTVTLTCNILRFLPDNITCPLIRNLLETIVIVFCPSCLTSNPIL